jgi:hypothetical protein
VNLDEAIDLLDDISDFNFKASEKPNISVYDNQKDGFVLCVKANLVDEEFRDHIAGIAESRKLGIRELEGYLIIHDR